MKTFVLCAVLISLVAVSFANGPGDGGNGGGNHGRPWGNGKPWGGDGDRKWGGDGDRKWGGKSSFYLFLFLIILQIFIKY